MNKGLQRLPRHCLRIRLQYRQCYSSCTAHIGEKSQVITSQQNEQPDRPCVTPPSPESMSLSGLISKMSPTPCRRSMLFPEDRSQISLPPPTRPDNGLRYPQHA